MPPSYDGIGDQLILDKIAGYCIDCGRFDNIVQQGMWQGFCYQCAADALKELQRLEAEA